MNTYQLEIACFNLESALIAQSNGADRIELCANMQAGGTTPDPETVKAARKQLHIPLYVMIRPRGGDFVYSDAEFEQMKSEILQFKTIQPDGFVFGILNADGNINKPKNEALIALANPLPCTFHRAFDVVGDVFRSLEDIIDCGFKTILTSGQAQDVMQGLAVLTTLSEKAGNRITIMPGGGLRSSNCRALKAKTNTGFYHSSAITDGSETANGDEVKRLKENLQ
ncbi:copper homeostasis protein CutC [Flavobacterium humi]|uniref:PF03932 family protein CutC n=1 Tax=Flavobacterium humi TaxID=2562683 RepID=A0A4Z0L4J9_9FLAO|nr:copper homeostasis protein CutC [Flavobacterium humi]TGD57387.1 copper homeostasis protein CutC [Flavobacterium humi]